MPESRLIDPVVCLELLTLSHPRLHCVLIIRLPLASPFSFAFCHLAFPFSDSLFAILPPKAHQQRLDEPPTFAFPRRLLDFRVSRLCRHDDGIAINRSALTTTLCTVRPLAWTDLIGEEYSDITREIHPREDPRTCLPREQTPDGKESN